MLQRVFRGAFGERGHPVIHELLHGGLQLVQGFRNLDAILVEHVLVVVHHDIFAIVRNAVPVAGTHDALVVVLAGVGQGAADFLIPLVFADVIVQIGEQALAGQQAGGGVALVVLHDIRSLIGIKDLGRILANLLEGLLFEFDLDAGFLFEDFHGLGPSFALGPVIFFIVPDFDGLRIALLCAVIAATACKTQCSEHGRHCQSGGDKFTGGLHCFSFSAPLLK